MTKSFSYALRSYVARVDGQFTKGVTLFLAISRFVKSKMVEAGYAPEQISVLENGVPIPDDLDLGGGDYVAYFGRMQAEKGVETLLAAAAQLPDCRFVFVGDGPERARLAASAPANCSFLGHRDRTAVEQLYRQARFVVIPSLWWEPFGLVVLEAMSYSKPVIVSRSGALPELIQDGITGLTFSPGNVHELTKAITSLWNDPTRVARMGRAGRLSVAARFSLPQFANGLMSCYERARVRMLHQPSQSASPVSLS